MNTAKKNYKTKKDHYIETWSNASDDAWNKAYKETYDSSRKIGMGKRKSEKRAMKIASESAGAAEGKVINKLEPGVVKAKNEYKLAKKEYKKERKKINENYDKKARIIDRYIYNEGTRRKVNKLMNNGMSMEEARKKTHKEAVRNTLGALALIGGGYLYAKKKI